MNTCLKIVLTLIIFGSFSHSLKCYQCKTTKKVNGRRNAFESFTEHACSPNEFWNIKECSSENPICMKTIVGSKSIDDMYYYLL